MRKKSLNQVKKLITLTASLISRVHIDYNYPVNNRACQWICLSRFYSALRLKDILKDFIKIWQFKLGDMKCSDKAEKSDLTAYPNDWKGKL